MEYVFKKNDGDRALYHYIADIDIDATIYRSYT